MIRGIIPLAVSSLLLGCQVPQPSSRPLEPGTVIGHPDSAIWRAVPPLDTSALFGMLHLADSAYVRWSADSTSGIAWQERIDAINVRNMMPACTCPDFAVIDSLRFGVKDVYLQPVNDSVRFPWRLEVAHNIFWLVGQRSVAGTLRPPETMGPPWPGYFFRYTSYRVVRPYQVWGPEIFDSTAVNLEGEGQWVPTRLTVR